MSEPPTNFELVKFLMERSHAEAQLFWTRNSVFLAIHPIGLGWIAQSAIRKEAPSALILVFAGILGVALAAMWRHVIYAGRRMNHQYVADAKHIVSRDPQLTEAFRHCLPLGKNTPNEAAFAISLSQDRGEILSESATKLMYLVAEIFMIAWAVAIVSGAILLYQTMNT